MIVSLLLTLGLSVLLVEFLRVMPLVRMLAKIQRTSGRALSVMRSAHISEHWKEKALLGYAQGMLVASSALAAILCGVAALVLVTLQVGDAMTGTYGTFLFGPGGLVLTCVAAGGWAWWRARG